MTPGSAWFLIFPKVLMSALIALVVGCLTAITLIDLKQSRRRGGQDSPRGDTAESKALRE